MNKTAFRMNSTIAMPLVLVFGMFVLFTTVTAKNESPILNDPFSYRLCRADFSHVQLSKFKVLRDAVVQHLKNYNTTLRNDQSSLKLLADIKSLGGRHFTFEQLYNGVPIFNSQIKVNLNQQNIITSIFDNSWENNSWTLITAATINEEQLLANLIKSRRLDAQFVFPRKVIAVFYEQPQIVMEIKYFDDQTNTHRLLLIDNNAEILLERNLATYFMDTIVEVPALVFIPDPLTSAEVTYGIPYVDNNDNDVAVINNERVPVDVRMTFDGNTYVPENEYIQLQDFDAPFIDPITTNTPDYTFTRSQSGFEDANALYHIYAFQQYVQSLGFNNLMNRKINVDTHAMNGDDNSQFVDHSSGPRLYFGEGGVDDAEDADVIVHEYGHALSNAATPNVSTNTGFERRAIDEGLCDYLAGSYSRSINPFLWENMFSWDGHNEYWAGRDLNTNKVYPQNANGTIHENGEIYAAALMSIWEQIGREETDKILLESLSGLAAGMTMAQAARLLFDADSALNNGNNFCVIQAALLKKGFVDSLIPNPCIRADSTINVNTGGDKSMCPQDSVTLGDVPVQGGRQFTYQWKPEYKLNSPDSSTTIAAPDTTTTYFLTVTAQNGSFNTDSITVSVILCDILIINTQVVIDNNGERVIIKFPDNSKNRTVEIFDMVGKRVFQETNIEQTTYFLDAQVMPISGGYIIRARTTEDKTSEKVMKPW